MQTNSNLTLLSMKQTNIFPCERFWDLPWCIFPATDSPWIHRQWKGAMWWVSVLVSVTPQTLFEKRVIGNDRHWQHWYINKLYWHYLALRVLDFSPFSRGWRTLVGLCWSQTLEMFGHRGIVLWSQVWAQKSYPWSAVGVPLTNRDMYRDYGTTVYHMAMRRMQVSPGAVGYGLSRHTTFCSDNRWQKFE